MNVADLRKGEVVRFNDQDVLVKTIHRNGRVTVRTIGHIGGCSVVTGTKVVAVKNLTREVSK